MPTGQSARTTRPPTGIEGGRANQRRRTRRAIVQAAARLLGEHGPPTVQQVADAAEVSRRTVYLYFPTHEQLLLDAAIEAIEFPEVQAALALADPRERVVALARAIQPTPELERAGRTLVRLTVEHEPGPPRTIPRGYRRMEWIQAAVEPLRDRLGKARVQRLAEGLAMVMGWEATIVQRDLLALDAQRAADLSAWAAAALVDGALAEAGREKRTRRP